MINGTGWVSERPRNGGVRGAGDGPRPACLRYEKAVCPGIRIYLFLEFIVIIFPICLCTCWGAGDNATESR